MNKIKEIHNSLRKMKNLKNQIVIVLDKKNTKLSSFFDECSLYEDNRTIIALIDNGNQFIEKVLKDDKHIILDVMTDLTSLYNDIKFISFKDDDDVYHLRCSTNGCINLPKKFMDKMKWKVGDEISIWENSIDDVFGIGKDPEGLDLMRKEDRDILMAHEDIKFN
tara:strand:+ start:59 stop:553 length:495 start_codon:yes stop_codon:yes gene_type:complete